MKKLVVTLTLAVSLLGASFTTAPKADAGVLTILSSATQLGGWHPARALGGVALGGLVTWGGFALANAHTGPWHIVGIVLIVLDAKQDLKEEGIEMFLAKKYPFINDRETLADLANLMRTQIVTSGGLARETNVKIPVIQTQLTLASSPLTAAQINQIATDLN